MTTTLAALVLLLATGGADAQIACGATVAPRDADRWDKARSPAIIAFCDKLAQGSARLARDPASALVAADEAEALLPEQAAVAVLRGRALVELGRMADAKAALERGASLDAAALSAPPALLALARAQRGAVTTTAFVPPPDAVASYRALVPRIEGLATEEQRSRALLEAGQVLLDEGPSGVDEAIAVFERLIASGDLSTRTRARAWLALALDRAGRGPEALMVAAAAARQGAAVLIRERDAASPSFAPLLATVLAPSAPSAAAAEYRGWVDRAQSSAWLAHGRAKVDALAKQKPIVQSSSSAPNLGAAAKGPRSSRTQPPAPASPAAPVSKKPR